MNTVIASRGSKLALWQAHHVKKLLETLGRESTILEIKTAGDRIQDRFLHEIGGKGVFIREIEEALLAGHADLGIHSLKDLPAELPKGFALPAILKRHSPNDVIVFSKSASARLSIPKEIVTQQDLKLFGTLKIATGSLRRKALLQEASSSIQVFPLRGNVDTRLRKLEEDGYDAIILAEASLDRLSLKSNFTARPIDPTWFVPSPSQGALALETITGHPLIDSLKTLACEETTHLVQLERMILSKLGADCTLPVGIHFQWESRDKGRVLTGRAVILSLTGQSARAEICIPEEYPIPADQIAQEMLAKLKANGGEAVMNALQLQQPLWPKESVFLKKNFF